MRLIDFMLVALLACTLVVPPALASDSGDALPLGAVRTQQAEIRAGVQARTGRYAALSERERNELLDRQTRMLRMIGDKQTSAELSEGDKLALFNELEWISATLNRSEDDRMVCERRAVLGSHHKERVCMTVGQKRIAAERARQELGGPSPQNAR